MFCIVLIASSECPCTRSSRDAAGLAGSVVVDIYCKLAYCQYSE